MIGDDEMIDIAEGCLIQIAETVIGGNIDLRQLFDDVAITEELEGQQIVLLSPLHFIEGLKSIGLEFAQLQIACLMNVLAKPQLENAILLDEVIPIMQNFGVQGGVGQPGPQAQSQQMMQMQAMQ